MKVIISGGCFWTLQAIFRRVRGVDSTCCIVLVSDKGERECLSMDIRGEAESIRKFHEFMFKNQSSDVPERYRAEWDLCASKWKPKVMSETDQDFFEKAPNHGYCESQIIPKMVTMMEFFPELFECD